MDYKYKDSFITVSLKALTVRNILFLRNVLSLFIEKGLPSKSVSFTIEYVLLNNSFFNLIKMIC